MTPGEFPTRTVPPMALRLSDSSSSSPRRGASQAPGALAQELAREAARLLSRKDLQAYAALVGRAAEIEDVHERYRSRCALVESGLGAAGQAPTPQVPALFAAA